MKSAIRLDLANPEVAASQILGTIYSRATVLRPCIALEIIREKFLETGGVLAQYEAGLNFALSKGWLALEENGSSVQFTLAGIDEYV